MHVVGCTSWCQTKDMINELYLVGLHRCKCFRCTFCITIVDSSMALGFLQKFSCAAKNDLSCRGNYIQVWTWIDCWRPTTLYTAFLFSILTCGKLRMDKECFSEANWGWRYGWLLLRVSSVHRFRSASTKYGMVRGTCYECDCGLVKHARQRVPA